jgi:hypothetical protein
MPALSTITVADNVPVNHVFSPTSGDSSNFVFNERTLSQTSAGQESMRLQFSKASVNRPTDKTTVRIDFPLEQLVDGVYVVYDIARVDINFTLPETMTSAQKLKVGAVTRNALAHATVKSYYETGEPVFA